MAPYIHWSLPLITTQIEFDLKSSPALLTITPCMEFMPDCLSLKRERERAPITDQHLRLDNQLPAQCCHKQESPSMVHSLEKRPAQPAEEFDSDLSDLSESNADLSDLEDPLLPQLQQLEASNKIPKPPSEPDQPALRGFSLEDTLMKSYGWSKENLEKLTVGTYMKPQYWLTFLGLLRRLCMQKHRRVWTWPQASETKTKQRCSRYVIR